MTVALRSGDDAEVARWLARKGVDFPVVNDANGALSAGWEISVTPTLVVVFTRSGCVHHQRLDQLLGHEASAVVGKKRSEYAPGFPGANAFTVRKTPVLRNRSRKNDPFLSHSERFDNNESVIGMKKIITRCCCGRGCFVVIRRTGADNAGRLSITTGADDEPP